MDSNDYLYHLDIRHVYDPLSYGESLLFQIGRLFCSPNSLIDTHPHINWLELTLVSGGRGSVSTNGVPSAVQKGDLYLSFPGDFHQIRSSEKEPLQFDFFSFNSTNPETKAGFEKLMKDFASPTKRVFRDERIPTLVGDAISELISKEPDKYTATIVESIFKLIFSYTLRDFFQKPFAETFGTTSKEEELAYQVMHYVDTHLFEIQKLSSLASTFGYNYSYLSNAFRKITGHTISRYFEDRRIAAAKSLLNENKLKVKEIALRLNYSSLYSFSKAFKNETGISPKGFQQKALEKPQS
jgi:AraC-like DNA-binding protein/mannose-6-phosphate isomerase-like protein (cupin superfamily)